MVTERDEPESQLVAVDTLGLDDLLADFGYAVSGGVDVGRLTPCGVLDEDEVTVGAGSRIRGM